MSNEATLIQDVISLSEKTKQVSARLSEVILRNDIRLKHIHKYDKNNQTSNFSNKHINRVVELEKYIKELETQNNAFKQLLVPELDKKNGSQTATSKTTSSSSSSKMITSSSSSSKVTTSKFSSILNDGGEAWEKKTDNNNQTEYNSNNSMKQQQEDDDVLSLRKKVIILEKSLEEDSYLISRLRARTKDLELEIDDLYQRSPEENKYRLNSGMTLLMEEILKLRKKVEELEVQKLSMIRESEGRSTTSKSVDRGSIRKSTRMSTTKTTNTVTNKDRGAVKAYRASSFAKNDIGGRSATTTTTTTTTSTSNSRIKGGPSSSSKTSSVASGETTSYDTLTSSDSVFKSRNEELENEMQVLVLKVKDLQVENEALSQNRSSVETKDAELYVLKAELEKARKEASKAQKFSLELETRLQKLRNEQLYSFQQNDLAKLVETLSTRNNNLSEQLKVREERLRDANSERKELSTVNLELEDEIGQLRIDLEKVERERDQNLKWRNIANDRGADINKLAHENALLRKEGEHGNTNLRNEVSDLREEMAELKEEISMLQLELDNKDDELKEALRIHEEREEYLQKTHEKTKRLTMKETTSAGVMAAMVEENRVLEQRTRLAEEEAETLRSFMENQRADRASESKTIGVLKLGLTKQKDKNMELMKEITLLKERSKELVFENQQLRDRVDALSAAARDPTFVIKETQEIKALKRELSGKEKSLEHLSNQLHHTRDELKRVHEQFQQHKVGVSVMVRVRPGDRDDPVHCEGNTVILPNDTFEFEKVFNSFAHQSDIFDEVQNIVNLCLDGQKVSVIAIGDRDTGKTYSILGERRDHGIIPRAVEHILAMTKIFEAFTSDRYSVEASFLGIHEEDVYDLFAHNTVKLNSKSEGKRLIFDDKDNLQLNKIFEAVALETYENSSRVFTLFIHCDSPNGSFSSSMSIFDLESAQSNQLLMDCLDGRGRALLLVHVSPSEASIPATTKALRFAEKAKDIHVRLYLELDDGEVLHGRAGGKGEETSKVVRTTTKRGGGGKGETSVVKYTTTSPGGNGETSVVETTTTSVLYDPRISFDDSSEQKHFQQQSSKRTTTSKVTSTRTKTKRELRKSASDSETNPKNNMFSKQDSYFLKV